MPRNTKLICMIEPQLEEQFRSICAKNGESASSKIRSMIIDELRLQGLLPENYIALLLKGTK
jgi:hypothetical protein